MVKIGNFTVHSDFPSLANDGNQTMTLTIPNGWAAGYPGHSYINADYTVGSVNSSIRAKITVDGTNWYVGTTASWTQDVNYTGIGADTAPFFVSVYRISPTVIRLQAGVYNIGGATMTTTGARTITAQVSTFITPF